MSSSEATIRYAIAKFTVIRRKRFVRGREQGQKDFYTAAFLYVREYARRETHQTRAAALFRSRDFIRAIDSKVELRLPHFLLLPFPFALTPFFHLLLLLLLPLLLCPLSPVRYNGGRSTLSRHRCVPLRPPPPPPFALRPTVVLRQ